jgi:hypothetical protein
LVIDADLAIGGRGPQPNDVTICLGCGYIMAFSHDMAMRELTNDEMDVVSRNREIILMQRSIAAGRKARQQ